MAIQINGNGTITGISVGGLPDGIVDTDMLATSVTRGKVLQIRHKIDENQDSTSSSSYTNSPTSGLNHTITPIAANSKILMTVHLQLEMSGANVCSMIFARDPAGTPVYFANRQQASNQAPANTSDGCSKFGLSQGYGSVNGQIMSHSGEDSPSYSVGDTLTYGILIGVNGNTAYYNRGIDGTFRGSSTITLMEIAA
jgi:hypothetical protein